MKQKYNVAYIVVSLCSNQCIMADEDSLFIGKHSNKFISRWEFQSLCNHIFDPRTDPAEQPTVTLTGGVTFDPQDVKPGDIIFVREIDVFMKKMHPKILSPYILVTAGDSLDACKEDHLDYLDRETIIAWFSVHPPKRFHKKFFPLPLGISQKREYHLQKTLYNNFFKELRLQPKKNLVSIPFNEEQHPERTSILGLLKNRPFCLSFDECAPFEEYLKTIASSKFTLSPRGKGLDCYRTWEALLVGSIPIITHCQNDVMDSAKSDAHSPTQDKKIESNLEKLYADLPILVIDDWKDINEKFLEQKYLEISSKKYNIESLFIEYWHQKLLDIRKEFFFEYRTLEKEEPASLLEPCHVKNA